MREPNNSVGVSHQTGWSGLVVTLIEIIRSLDPEQVLAAGGKSLSPS